MTGVNQSERFRHEHDELERKMLSLQSRLIVGGVDLVMITRLIAVS